MLSWQGRAGQGYSWHMKFPRMEDYYLPPSSISWPWRANCDMPPEHSLKASPDSRFYRSTSLGSNPARAIKAGCLSSSLVRLGGVPSSLETACAVGRTRGVFALHSWLVNRGDADREFCSCEQHK